jgi:hypothetical protein
MAELFSLWMCRMHDDDDAVEEWWCADGRQQQQQTDALPSSLWTRVPNHDPNANLWWKNSDLYSIVPHQIDGASAVVVPANKPAAAAAWNMTCEILIQPVGSGLKTVTGWIRARLKVYSRSLMIKSLQSTHLQLSKR